VNGEDSLRAKGVRKLGILALASKYLPYKVKTQVVMGYIFPLLR
jgi:hypothetical protein